MITIVNYGMGNLGSIRNMLKKIGVDAEITSDPSRIARARKLILPGVGAFDAGMESLERSGLQALLDERVLGAGVPILGICLGMQLMTRRSSEGTRNGLGWIDAEALRLQPADRTLKVPHMGWNLVRRYGRRRSQKTCPTKLVLLRSLVLRAVPTEDEVLLTTTYGQSFHSGFHRGNVWGVQFHPEKSHKFGMRLLRNFAELC